MEGQSLWLNREPPPACFALSEPLRDGEKTDREKKTADPY